MKKPARHKIFSGALQFTVFIGVVIALMLAGLVLLQSTDNFFIQQSKSAIENIQLANSGMNFLKQADRLIADTTIVEKLNANNQKVEVQSSQWGIYEKAIVKATHRKKIFYKCALMGTRLDDIKRPNLYLQDNSTPLLLVGNTILKGNLFLPSQGVKSGYIAGESFYGTELISGISYLSNVKIPQTQDGLRERIEEQSKFLQYKPENYLNDSEKLSCRQSFLKPTKIWDAKGSIILDGNQFSGNLIIKSEEKITVRKSASLKDIILIAPIIEIEDGVSGNFQAISNKKIKVGKECRLLYPSALIYIQEKDNMPDLREIEAPIYIDKKTEIRGSIIYLKHNEEKNFKTQITVEEQCQVKGEIYCEGNLELKATVVGSVYTEQFIANNKGTVYINHIYNGRILNDLFPDVFCGLLLKDTQKGVAKWLF